jgi:hypothetical protein
LEAYTSEKVYIIAGPEFKDCEGHILIISRALYGLRSSGARWHDRFADCIRELGFFPCKAEPDIWMRKKGNIYEYVAVYVSSFLSERRENNTLYVENSLDVGTKELYQLSTYIHKYKKRTSTQVLCRKTTSYY